MPLAGDPLNAPSHAALHNTEDARLGALESLPINTQVASYSLVLADANKIVEMNVAGVNNLTVPTNAAQAIPIGSAVVVTQLGAGATTIVAAGGVTIRCRLTLVLKGQYSVVWLYKRGTNEWVLSGDLT